MLPMSFIPRERVRSPQAANTTTPARTRYLRQLTIGLERRLSGFHSGLGRRNVLLFALLLHDSIARGTQFQESTRFTVEALALVSIKDSFLDDAEDRLGAEVVLVVEAVHRFENLFARQAGIFDVRQLM